MIGAYDVLIFLMILLVIVVSALMVKVGHDIINDVEWCKSMETKGGYAYCELENLDCYCYEAERYVDGAIELGNKVMITKQSEQCECCDSR